MRGWLMMGCWLVGATSAAACGGASSTRLEEADPSAGSTSAGSTSAGSTSAGSASAGSASGNSVDVATPSEECGERLEPVWVNSGLQRPSEMATASYVGAAVVERSTSEELVFAYDSADSAPELRHAEVSGSESRRLPVMPTGAQVWLSVTEVFRNLQGLRPGAAIAVKTKDDGPLLIGYASGTTTPGLPSAKRVEHASCTVHENPVCPRDASSYVTYMAAELQGDDPIVIDDSKTQTLQLAGLAYDVLVTARLDVTRCGVFDYFPPDVTFDLRAQNLDTLVAGLAQGSPPL